MTNRLQFNLKQWTTIRCGGVLVQLWWLCSKMSTAACEKLLARVEVQYSVLLNNVCQNHQCAFLRQMSLAGNRIWWYTTTTTTRHRASTSMYSLTQGRSQDFISTEAKGWTGCLGRSPQRGPGAEPLVSWSGWSPSEAESFSVVRYAKEMENLL